MAKNKVNVEEVFTPSIQAVKTFVERDTYTTDILVDSLRTPGKQIVLYGHTGCGKSTLLKNKLNQVYEHRIIITRCMKDMTYESMIINAIDQLDYYFLEEAKTNKSQKFTTSLSIFNSIQAIKNKFEYQTEKSIDESYKRILPPQLTAQRLAGFMGEVKACWVLEDFHKLPIEVKSRFSQTMKIFVDCSVDYSHIKIIALGALNSARQVIEHDIEMNNRISEIYVRLMNDDEIEQIVNKGENLLNLYFSKEVKDMIVKISNGLPSITHQLCLNICFSQNIYETQMKTIFIDRNQFITALRRYIDERSDTIKKDFDRAVKVIDTTNILSHYTIIKSAISAKKQEFSLIDIANILSKEYAGVNKEIVSIILNELCLEERGEILTFDQDSYCYSFSNYFMRSYAILRLENEHHEVIDSKSKLKDVLIGILIEDGFFTKSNINPDDLL